MTTRGDVARVIGAAGVPLNRLCYFEKWYVDGQTKEGDFFFLYVAPSIFMGKASAEFVCSLYPRAGGEHRARFQFKANQFEVDDDRAGVRFDGGHLRIDDGELRFEIDRPELTAKLNYELQDPPWEPTDGGVLFSDGKSRVRWVVPMPRGYLRGAMRIGDEQRELSGHGYSDFVQSNFMPWKLPLRELLWGRAVSDDLLVVWNRVGTEARGEINRITRVLVRDGAGPVRVVEDPLIEMRDWIGHDRTGERYPDRMSFGLTLPSGHEASVRVSDTRLLLGDFVADVQPYTSKLERWVYRALTGNPVEYKLLSKAELNGRIASAAHEWVLWGRDRSATPPTVE